MKSIWAYIIDFLSLLYSLLSFINCELVKVWLVFFFFFLSVYKWFPINFCDSSFGFCLICIRLILLFVLYISYFACEVYGVMSVYLSVHYCAIYGWLVILVSSVMTLIHLCEFWSVIWSLTLTGFGFLVDRYLTELLAERHKLSPFMPVLPNCYRLINQGKFCIYKLL